MTAATVLRHRDAVLIEQARAVWSRARDVTFGRPAVAEASWQLGDAIEFYRLIWSGQVTPLSAYEELKTYHPEGEWYARALQMAAEDAVDEAREVVRVIGERIGDKEAAFVGGENNGGTK